MRNPHTFPASSRIPSWPRFRHLSSAFLCCAALLLSARDACAQEPSAPASQIWSPQVNAAERCVTCHPPVPPPSPAQIAFQQSGRVDPLVPHHGKGWGCTICHRGAGDAAHKDQAHQPPFAPAQPLLPARYLQASCGLCHRADLPDTPQLNRGRFLLSEFRCVGCHRLDGIDRPAMLGPDLTEIASKVSPEWLYKWLKEPRTLLDDSGNVTVNGYQMEPRMPRFRLQEDELRNLVAYLSSLRGKPVEPYAFDPKVVAALQNSPDLADQGEARFRQMFCTTCHPLAVTRAGETKLIGGDLGPELTKVGSKVNPDWLAAWLRNPQALLPKSKMPRYEWSDQDLYLVTRFITAKLTDPDLLQGVPKLDAPAPDQIRLGRRLFLRKGCASCHAAPAMKLQEDFGPNLSSLGAESVSHLHFGDAKIPRDLTAYIQAKLTEPLSVNPTAEMPQYRFNFADLEALTTALLSMTGASSNSALERVTVPRKPSAFQPTGEFARIYERYKCYACHQFNGTGGTLATDLSWEGSRAQRQWLIEFLKNPQTLRPSLVLRMPQFNMTDQEAALLADAIGQTLRNPAVNPAAVDPAKFTTQMAAKGKQLYEDKYMCSSCHSIGSGGGYVGPELSNVGNWMTPAWIAAWLKDPQALLPGGIEPRRTLSPDEIQALTAYLMTLRQKEPTAHTAAAAGAEK